MEPCLAHYPPKLLLRKQNKPFKADNTIKSQLVPFCDIWITSVIQSHAAV